MDYKAIVEVYNPDGTFMYTLSFDGLLSYSEARLFADRVGEVKTSGSAIDIHGLGIDDGLVTFAPEGFELERLKAAYQHTSIFDPKVTKVYMVIASEAFLESTGGNPDDEAIMTFMREAEEERIREMEERQRGGVDVPGPDLDDVDDADPEAVLEAAANSATEAGMNPPPMD